MNLGMYVINKLFHGYFVCTIFIHSLCKTNERARTTCEYKSYALRNREITYKSVQLVITQTTMKQSC